MKKGINLCYPDPANARKHSSRNLSAIKASLLRFGQQKPIVVDSQGVIIAGNGTWEAAKALGWKTIEVKVSQLEGSDRSAYAIADNKTAALADRLIDETQSDPGVVEVGYQHDRRWTIGLEERRIGGP